MTTELTLVLRFEDYAPTREDVEEALDCVVLEWEEEDF